MADCDVKTQWQAGYTRPAATCIIRNQEGQFQSIDQFSGRRRASLWSYEEEQLMLRHHAVTLTALFLAIHAPALVAAESEPTTRPDPDGIAAIQTLNYLQGSLERIRTSPNSAVLEREYDTFLENLNLQAIPDKEEVDLIQSLMDALVTARLAESEREQIQLAADSRADSAMRNLIGRMVDIAAGAVVENPVGAVTGSTQAVVAYLNDDEDARARNAAANLRLNDTVLKAINEFQKVAVKVAWEVGHRHHVPDEWRLTREQIQEFSEAATVSDLQLRMRKLIRLRDTKDYVKYPPFWCYLGGTSLRLGHFDDAERAYAQFDASNRGIFRHDPYLMQVSVDRTLLAMHRHDDKAAGEQLGRLRQCWARNDWEAKVFAAECYRRLGQFDEAEKVLQENIDNARGATLSNRLLGEVLLQKDQKANVSAIMNVLLADKGSGLDPVYLAAKTQSDEVLAKVFTDLKRAEMSSSDQVLYTQVPARWSGVEPGPASSFGVLTVQIPRRWSTPGIRVAFDAGGRDYRDISLYQPSPDTNDTIIVWHILAFQSEALLNDGVRDITLKITRDAETYLFTYDLKKVSQGGANSLKEVRVGDLVLRPVNGGFQRVPLDPGSGQKT
jgi:tetratricopeptide (TPR) repeat protein